MRLSDKELFDVFENEIVPAARTYAEHLHEEVSVEMTAGMSEAVADVFDAETMNEEQVRDIILPGFKAVVFERLAELAEDASGGWLAVRSSAQTKHGVG